MIKGMEHLSYEECMRELDLFILKKIMLRRINVFKLTDGESKDGAGIFSMVPNNRMRGEETSLNTGNSM